MLTVFEMHCSRNTAIHDPASGAAGKLVLSCPAFSAAQVLVPHADLEMML